HCAGVVLTASREWQAATVASARAFADAGLARSEAIVATIANDRTSPIQPGLFDRRAHTAQAALRAAHAELLVSQQERTESLRRSRDVVARSPRLQLVLVP